MERPEAQMHRVHLVKMARHLSAVWTVSGPESFVSTVQSKCMVPYPFIGLSSGMAGAS
jgi:hypothetical protein